MGARKHIKAEALKEAKKSQYFATLEGVAPLPRARCAMLLTWSAEWR